MQTLSEIKAMLAAHDMHPKKRFGQNFLHDANQIRKIVATAEVEPGDLVLEVGPGTGALSVALLEAGACLGAVEIDEQMKPILQQQFEPFGDRVCLLVTDVLAGKHEVSPQVFAMLRELAAVCPRNEGEPTGVEPVPGVPADAATPPFKLIANLPYNVASPLLVNLGLQTPAMTRAVVMVQREVADRIAAGPGGKTYGPLGVLLQAMFEVRTAMTLPPSCFWPRPDVDSAVVLMERRAQPLTNDPPTLQALLHKLFTRRRKQIGSTLGRDIDWPQGIDPQARPEQLSVEQLIALASVVARS